MAPVGTARIGAKHRDSHCSDGKPFLIVEGEIKVNIFGQFGAMEPTPSEQVIKKYLESQEIQCSENVPRVLLTALSLFLDDMLERTGVDDPANLTPEDIARVIQETPEYRFLTQLIPQITKKDV